MNLTSAELSLLRNQPHRTNLWLSIYRPNTIMSAIVTGTYNIGDTNITYISPSGSYLNLYPDLTVMVGSQRGLDDQGRIRMRAASGTYVVFAENAINWQSGQYLTFLDYVTVEAIYPKIIQDPSNAENVIFYKDSDIPYSNQNFIYGTFPCAGPHRAGFLTSGTATFYYTATGTYNVAGQSLTYSWLFDGGTPTGSTALTPGNVTYNQAGHYKTRLRVTAANGAVDDTYRYVSVYDRPYAGTNTPVLRWELQDFSGSRNEGGYTASFKVFDNADWVEPNALVVIFAETWYGGTKQNIGGNAQGNQSIVFAGYIISDTIKFNYKESYVEFQAGSVSEIMKETEGFSVSCESKASPATWFELYEMTVPKAIYHYLRWHSTVLKVADFQYLNDDRLVQYFDADRGSLYDAVDSFMREGMLGSVISDRQGKLWAEISPFGLETPLATIPNYFTFHKQDWVGTPTIQERRNSEVSFIELGGIAYYGVSSNLFSALLSNAPSTAPLYHGKSSSPTEGLILTSQLQLNQIAGNYLAHQNTRFPDITMPLAGAYLNLDITPLEQTRLVIDANDSVRGRSIQDLPYIVDSIEWSYDSANEMLKADATLLQIATGTAGVTVLIPAVPPDGGYKYPDFQLPPLPTFGDTNPVGPQVNTIVVLHDTTYGIIYTPNFDSSNPQWFTMNMGLTTTQYQGINWLIVCPNGALYCGIQNRADSDMFIARASSVGQPWAYIETYATIAAKYPAAVIGVSNATFHPSYPEKVAYAIGTSENHRVYHGVNGVFSPAYNMTTFRNNDLTMAYGETVLKVSGVRSEFPSGRACYVHLSLSGGSLIRQNDLPADLIAYNFLGNQDVFKPGGISKIDYFQRDFFSGAYRFLNDLQDTPVYLADDINSCAGLGVDHTGMYLMGQWDVAAKGRSSDGGTTWTALPTLPPNASYQFCYAGTGQRWIAVGQGAVIRYSPDFGQTWLNREGNITTINAIPSINMVRVVGTPLR